MAFTAHGHAVEISEVSCWPTAMTDPNRLHAVGGTKPEEGQDKGVAPTSLLKVNEALPALRSSNDESLAG